MGSLVGSGAGSGSGSGVGSGVGSDVGSEVGSGVGDTGSDSFAGLGEGDVLTEGGSLEGFGVLLGFSKGSLDGSEGF